MKRLAVVLVLAGCDAVFGLSRPPPDAMNDAPPDAPDGDDDGVADVTDNCLEAANADQLDRDNDLRGDACDLCPLIPNEIAHDEDRDAVGDQCDNCPHIANTDQGNTDGDGLGDACDLAMTFECITLFEPFTSMPAASSENVGTWSVEDDLLVQSSATASDGYFVFPTTYATPRLETRARVREIPDTGASGSHVVGGWVSIQSASLRAGVPAGMLGRVQYSPINNGTNLIATHTTSAPPPQDLRTVTLTPTVLLEPGTVVTLRVQLPSTTEIAVRADLGPSVAAFPFPLTGRPPGRVGLRTVEMAVGFEYVTVIETQPSGPCP